MIAIIDYDVGNIKSVCNAMDLLEMDWVLTRDKKEIQDSTAIILPGVGAFEDAISSLKEHGLVDLLREEIAKGKPFLGICLGMQLLFQRSYENGIFEGLGALKGDVIPFQTSFKVPHMGWNSLKFNPEKKDHPILKRNQDGEYVYFVHSYYVDGMDDETIAFGEYDQRFSALVGKGSLIGMQFHPEKSGDVGLRLLESFKEMIE